MNHVTKIKIETVQRTSESVEGPLNATQIERLLRGKIAELGLHLRGITVEQVIEAERG